MTRKYPEVHPQDCNACVDASHGIYGRFLHVYIPVICFCGKMKAPVIIENDGKIIKCSRGNCIERVKE